MLKSSTLEHTLAKWDDFNFEVVNFPFLDRDVPMVYIFCNLLVLRESVLMLMTSNNKQYLNNIGLKTLLRQGISEPIFYGDLVLNSK